MTTMVSELGTTLHPAVTCNVRAASVLGHRWLSAARTLHHVRTTATNGRACSRLRSEKVGFLCMLPWYNGHSDTFSMPPPFHTGQKKEQPKKKRKSLHLGFMVKMVTLMCFSTNAFSDELS